jgi:hypothetical protein
MVGFMEQEHTERFSLAAHYIGTIPFLSAVRRAQERRITRRAHVARGRRLQRTRRRIVAVALIIAAVAAVLALT